MSETNIAGNGDVDLDKKRIYRNGNKKKKKSIYIIF